MSFLSPLWLAALAALLLPLLLHLISRGRGKRVRVGSIALLAATARRRAHRLQPSQLLLLLVRCLLLSALALTLAAPLGPRLVAADEGAVTVLVSPALLAARGAGETEGATFGALEARLATGHPVRLLVSGLPPWEEGEPLPADGGVDLWSLLAEADRALAPGTHLAIFAADRLADLRGERPTLRHPFTWHAVALPVAPTSLAPVAARGVEVAIYTAPERADAAAHVRAALAAIGEVAELAVTVRQEAAGEGAVGEPDADLILWLADAPVPAQLMDAVAAGGVLVRDAAAPYTDCDATVHPPAGGRLVLRRCAPAAGEDAAVLWRDSNGAPFLTAMPAGDGMVYALHSRFDPAWSDFVLQPLFPRWLLAHLEELAGDRQHGQEEGWEEAAADPRPAPGQGAPRQAGDDAMTPSFGVQGPRRDLTSLLWLLVGALLAVERWLATAEAAA